MRDRPKAGVPARSVVCFQYITTLHLTSTPHSNQCDISIQPCPISPSRIPCPVPLLSVHNFQFRMIHCEFRVLSSWCSSVNIVLYSLLSGVLNSAPLMLPGRHMMNAGLMTASVGGMIPFMLSADYATGMGCLVGVSGLSTVMVRTWLKL